MFSVLSLNVKGLRNCKKRKKMLTWLLDHKWHSSVTFLQESHSDIKTFSNWIHDCKVTSISSHGTTHSAGVITHIGKHLEFKLIDKIIDTNGRYIILYCEVQGNKYLFVNIYAPNTEKLQLLFLSEVEQCMASLNISAGTSIIMGGDFNSHFTDADADGGRCIIKQRTVKKLESIMCEYDLCDIRRIRNVNTTRYTSRSFNPLIQRRLDFFLISNNLQSSICSSEILNTDHSAVTLSVNLLPNTKFGPSHWKLNTSLLTEKEYVDALKNNIDKWKEEIPDGSAKTRLGM